MPSTRSMVALGLALLGLFRLSHCRVQRQEALDLCATFASGRSARLRGSPFSLGNRRWGLYEPAVVTTVGTLPFHGEVEIESIRGEWSASLGREIYLEGQFQCRVPYQNPGKAQDGLWALTPAKLWASGNTLSWVLADTVASPRARFQFAFRQWITDRLSQFPLSRAFSLAVWTGDVSGLPEGVLKFYRQSGLLPVLALSGQHVTCLVLVLLVLLRAFSCVLPSSFYCVLQPVLPIFGSLLLWLTSPGTAPIQRTLAMAAGWCCLRQRRLHCSLLQLVCSSIGILILWDPLLIASPSFFLSVAATATLGAVWGEHRISRAFVRYLSMSVLMPLLALPLALFFFAKVAVLAPLWSLLGAFLWDVALIPLGFFLPVIPSRGFAWTEWCLTSAASFHGRLADWNTPFFRTGLCPQWGEVLVFGGLSLVLVLGSLTMRK